MHCVITIPLNCIDDSKIESNIKLSENILLFKTEKQFAGHKKIETPLEKYFKEKVYKLLLRDHIEKAIIKKFKKLFTALISSIIIMSISPLFTRPKICENAMSILSSLKLISFLSSRKLTFVVHFVPYCISY